MRMMDTTIADCSAATETRPSGLWAALVRVFRSRRHRAHVAQLDALTDHELYDIGLTRLDLRVAMFESRFFEDPSLRLKSAAGRRRGP